MDIPFLKTKLYIPSLRPELVSRPRLLERLKMGLQSKLTLVSAPAGYGKTTMVSKGVRSSQMPVGWLTLDDDDDDPIRFWSYAILALQTIKANIGESILGLFQSSHVPPIESIMTTIINEMSGVSEEFALVFDDYHVIRAQPIHDALTFLLKYLPPQAHLVISSRIDPPIPLAHLRAQNQLIEVRAADLRFIPEEVTAFLNDVMSLGLSDEDITALESRTEGWIAGLQLAAISMQGRKDIPNFITAFSGSSRHILEYLTEEVLGRQEASTQSFLLKTAILNRFTASLCNAVTGRDDSQEILAQLEANNMFLVALDDERRWYRYHHLFGDLLRNRLMQSRQEDMTELHLRASQWFEQEGLISEAIYHALAAENFERAANLVESVALTMLMQSYCPPVLSWLEKLPSALLMNRPWLCLAGAIANQVAGHPDAVEPLLQCAESVISRFEQERPTESFLDHARIRGYVITVRIIMSLIEGDIQRVIELCHEAFKYLPEDDLIARVVVVGSLGISYWVIGELPAARRYLEEANTLGQAVGHFYYSLFALSYLGDIYRVQGHLHQAAQKYREALLLGAQWGGVEPLPASGNAYVGLSQVLYEWNDVNGAIHHASVGTKLAERGGVFRTVLIGYSLLAWQNQACGNTKAIMEALQRGEGIRPEAIIPHTLLHASAWTARLSLVQGDLNAVNRWAASQEPKLNLQETPDFWSELSYLTLVRLRIAQGEVDEIPGLLERLRQKVEAENRTGSLIEILALQAIALQTQGEVDQALATLERALSLAEPENYVRTFIDEGEPMAKLLHLAASRGIAKKYVKKLLASFRIYSESQPRVSPAEGATAPSPLIEPLSKRELELLRLIVAGMSNREIAQKLFIGEGTVKTHINHIYGKLDVQSRTQAIGRARELELL